MKAFASAGSRSIRPETTRCLSERKRSSDNGRRGVLASCWLGASRPAPNPVRPDPRRPRLHQHRRRCVRLIRPRGELARCQPGYAGGQIFHLAFSGVTVAGTFDDWGVFASPRVAQTDWQILDGGAPFEWIAVRGDSAGRAAVYYLAIGKIIRRSFPGTTSSDYAPFQPHLGFAVDPTSNSNVVLASENPGSTPGRVHRTLDGDQQTPTWQVESGITLAAGDQVIALAIVPGGAQRRAYAASDQGNVFYNPDVGPGRAGAGPWQLMSTWPPPSSPAGKPVRGVAVESSDPDTIVIWSADAAAVSHTRGSVWHSITGTASTALPAGGIVAIVADLGAPHLYAGLEAGGVFESHDEGNSWHPLRRGLPTASSRRSCGTTTGSTQRSSAAVSGACSSRVGCTNPLSCRGCFVFVDHSAKQVAPSNHDG